LTNAVPTSPPPRPRPDTAVRITHRASPRRLPGLACLVLALLAVAAVAGAVPAWAQGVEEAEQSAVTVPTPAPSDAPDPTLTPPPTGPWAPDTAEAGSVEAIRRHTTAEEFLPETVAYLPASLTVPSPMEVLGHVPGAEGELSSVAEVHGYMRALAAASDRVTVRTLGLSEEGREILLVLVSSADNLAGLDRWREINRGLADPRRTDRETARALAEEGRAVYYLLGGLHSTETGSPEMLMELAYRLAVSEKPAIREIRDEMVVAITPVVEPDGRDRVVEWYERHQRGRDLEWEELREFSSPPYWGHYVFHDNNRDGMQRTQALTRAVHDAFYDLRPQVVHDLHESLPLLYISTGHGPYSTAVDPLTINRWTWFAHNEAAQLQAQGLPGVWVWGFWDGWWPGYLVSVANNHHSVGRFYETFGNSHPGTFERDLSDVEFLGEEVTGVQWYRPWPPDEEVTWSLRNNTNYMQAGVLEALHLAARHRSSLLADGWVKARRSMDRGRDEAPHAWVFPVEQRDPGALSYLVSQLLAHDVEVHRIAPPPGPTADDAGEAPAVAPPAPPGPAGGAADADAAPISDWPVGSFVVRMDQPLRDLAVTLLEVQRFPPDEPNPPYDDVAWTWPLLYGVEGERVDDPEILDVPMAEVTMAPSPGGGVTGFGEDIYLLADTGQSSLLTARALLGDHQVDAAEQAFEVNGVDYPAGSWIVQAPRAEVEEVAARLGLTFRAALSMPRVASHLVDLPRLGLVHTWTSTQDAGWARYTLDQARMPYTLVSPDDLRRGGLLERFDVLLMPRARGDFARMVHGIDPALGPLAYTQTDRFPSHGVPNASPDVTGGMGLAGLMELQRFVAGGGMLVTLGNSGTLAVDGGLVRRVVRRPASSVRNPGSELAARVRRAGHPLTYGYPEKTSVFRGNGPLFDVPDRYQRHVVLQFGDELPEDDGGDDGGAPMDETLAMDRAILVETLDPRGVDMGPEAGDPDAGQDDSFEARIIEEDLAADASAEPPGEGGSGRGAAGGEGEEAGEEDLRDLVLSGWVSAEEPLAGEPAILDVPSGRGRVLLYSFNPLHRHLNHSDFRLLYNALLHWNDLP